jgi:hypothetical protein
MNTKPRVPDLLDQFLRDECTGYDRDRLEQAINDTSKVRIHVDFNRFVVTIESTYEAGTLRMSIAQFVDALQYRTAVSGATR